MSRVKATQPGPRIPWRLYAPRNTILDIVCDATYRDLEVVSAIGIVARNADGEVAWTVAECVDCMSSNAAELAAVERALLEAARRGAAAVCVSTDSTFAKRRGLFWCGRGAWQHPDPEFRRLVSAMRRAVVWVERARVREAHQLAAQAAHGARHGRRAGPELGGCWSFGGLPVGPLRVLIGERLVIATQAEAA